MMPYIHVRVALAAGFEKELIRSFCFGERMVWSRFEKGFIWLFSFKNWQRRFFGFEKEFSVLKKK